jgi:site-specific recombinase XerD
LATETSNTQLIADYTRFIHAERGLSENTVLAYSGDLWQFAEILEQLGCTIFQATPADLSSFLQHLADHQIDKPSRARKVAAIRGFYRWLIRAERLEKDPTRLTVLPKLDKRMPNPVPRATMKEILERTGKRASAENATALEIRDHAILEVMYSSGVRVSELCGMLQGELALSDSTAKVMGKGRKQRIVLFGESAVVATRNYLRFARPLLAKTGKGKQPALFLSQRGTQISRWRVGEIVVAAGAALDVDERIHCHRLRHSCATDLLRGDGRQGADLRVVQELLGHQNLNTTQNYVQLLKDQLQDAHARFHPRG